MRVFAMRAGLVLAGLSLAACVTRAQEPTANAATAAASTAVVAPIEQGKFTLHKFEQPIGEETYTVTPDGEALAVAVNFKFTDRASAVPLTATFRGTKDWTPLAFTIKGKTARPTTIDEAVDVTAGGAKVRVREEVRDVTPPATFFTIAGYAPATMQQLMVRYWAGHGSPAALATLPNNGTVKIEPRGQDVMNIDGKNVTLDRYTVEGLIWGRESLWFDAQRNLVAEVSVDAEFDHFEAIRDGYESGLGQFVGRAGADGMAALAELSKGISGSRAETIAIVGATLIDGTGAAPVPNATVVIEKGRITAAGPSASVKIPGGAQKVDAHGKYVLPGLWDMHAHFEQVEWGPIYLAAGATTVRDCGNEFEFITAVRDAVAAGKGLGPRLELAGIVDGTGKYMLGVARVDTPEQAKMWVDKYHDANFQQIKIYSSVKLRELKVVADEAHRLGMTTTGHIPEGLNAYQAVEAGQDQINHVEYVADIMHPELPETATRRQKAEATAHIDVNSPEAQKAIAFLVQHHTVVDPTLAIFEMETASQSHRPETFEPGVLRVAPELSEQLLDVGPAPPPEINALINGVVASDIAIVGALHKAGVPIVAGTDQTVPGFSLYREIELYVQAGFTPMEALQAATIVPARVMKLDKELGTVEAGKRADLIIVGANPLDDIHNIRKVQTVVTGGVMYDCAELWKSVGFKAE